MPPIIGKAYLGRVGLDPAAQVENLTPTKVLTLNETTNEVEISSLNSVVGENFVKLDPSPDTSQSISKDLFLTDNLIVNKDIESAGNIQADLFTASIPNSPSDLPDRLVRKDFLESYVSAFVTGIFRLAGNWDASGGTFPTTGTGVGNAVQAGDSYIVTVDGTIGGQVYGVGDSFYAKVNAPGQTASNWARFEVPTGQASSVLSGIMKLYTSTGSSTDGTMDRNSITNLAALKANKAGGNTFTGDQYIVDNIGIGTPPTVLKITAQSTGTAAVGTFNAANNMVPISFGNLGGDTVRIGFKNNANANDYNVGFGAIGEDGAFFTNDTVRARITQNGNFLIGTATDDGVSKLQVSGSIKAFDGLERTILYKDGVSHSEDGVGEINLKFNDSSGVSYTINVPAANGDVALYSDIVNYVTSFQAENTSITGAPTAASLDVAYPSAPALMRVYCSGGSGYSCTKLASGWLIVPGVIST